MDYVGSFLVLATAGAGGDLQPLVSATLALRERGHRPILLGDSSVERALGGLGLDIEVLPPTLDLAPRLIGAIQEAMAATGGDPVAAGPLVQEQMTAWAQEVARPTSDAVRRVRPDALLTSLFGVEALHLLSPSAPWAVINSTFALGGDHQRPLDEDFGPRAVPLIARYQSLLDSASLVLHATDPVFDFGGEELPPHHRYVGPLGIWEPDTEPVAGLDEPGAPWVLATISSQLQDDLRLADAALSALADRPVRVLLSLGPGHDRSELSRVPPNARVESVVSHAEVLGRAVLLLSHAGHGSVMKALWYGRPMVLVPWGRDQPGVAARAHALGVAVVVPPDSVSTAALPAALDKALADVRMRRRAEQHAVRLQVTNPPAVAADLLETLL
jgi:UDP:flavonoid glycosyltransferase YjiC (YdhE family)